LQLPLTAAHRGGYLNSTCQLRNNAMGNEIFEGHRQCYTAFYDENRWVRCLLYGAA